MSLYGIMKRGTTIFFLFVILQSDVQEMQKLDKRNVENKANRITYVQHVFFRFSQKQSLTQLY